MGEAAMVREVMKIILDEDGDSMYFDEIRENYSGKHPLKLNKLQVYDSLFEISQDENGHMVTIIAPTKICPDHSKPSGCQLGNCEMFHICKFYILSYSCKNRNCNFGHSLSTNHNKQLLKSMHLDHHDIKVVGLRILFCRMSNRTRGSLPVHCNHYNWKRSCQRADKCNHLHICGRLLMGGCKYGGRCNRNHNVFSENVQFVLDRYGIVIHEENKLDNGDSVIQDLINMYKDNNITLESLKDESKNCQSNLGSTPGPSMNNLVDSVSKVEGAGLVPESKRRKKNKPSMERQSTSSYICINFMRGLCRLNEKCRYLHVKSTYQWQWIPDTKDRSQEWENLSPEKNLKIERCYCNLQELTNFTSPYTGMVYSIKFDYLEENDIRFRRINTMDLTPETSLYHQPWATKWIWYWLDNNGKWIEYGQKDTLGHIATVKSKDIEIAYQKNKDGNFNFTSEDTGQNHGGQGYTIDFKEMAQTNIQYGTVRKIKRRPEFTDNSVIQKRKDESREAKKLNIPSNWSRPPNDDIYSHYQIVELNPTSEEYVSVKKSIVSNSRFIKDISSVKRIENMELWTAFCVEKEIMDRKLKRDVPIKRLYHGTDSSIIEAICIQGFDCRLSGSRVGHLYGKGGYFGIDCDVSSNYCDDSNLMFVVKALVGDYTLGSKDYPRPPLKNPNDPSSALYDSCVDNKYSPTMFVLFNNRQVYPEYLVKYKTQGSQYLAAQNTQKPMSSAQTNPRSYASPTAPVRPMPTYTQPVQYSASASSVQPYLVPNTVSSKATYTQPVQYSQRGSSVDTYSVQKNTVSSRATYTQPVQYSTSASSVDTYPVQNTVSTTPGHQANTFNLSPRSVKTKAKKKGCSIS